MKDTPILIIILLVFLVLLLFGGGFGMMSFNGYGMMNGFGWIIMALFVVALVLFIMWLIKQLGAKK